MNVLPRLLYLFSCVPTHLPRPFFQMVARLLSGFVWANRHPRIARSILVRRKTDGGLALPDCQSYYQSTVLTRVLDSFHGRGRKQWIDLESSDAHLDPRALLWLPRAALTKKVISSLPPVLASIASMRASYLNCSRILTPDGPMTPVFGNANFPPAYSASSFLGRLRSAGTTFGDFVAVSNLQPLETLLESGVVSVTASFQYAQLRHFYEASKQSLQLHRSLTPYERLCLSSSAVSRPVSVIYNLFLDSFRDSQLPFRRGWETAIGRQLSDEEWTMAVLMCHKTSISCKAQETNYKLLTRWYRVPALLSRFYPSVPDTCWRCGGPGGTITHIWLECPALALFWSQVLNLIYRMTTVRLPLSPVPLLLSVLPASVPGRARTLLRFLLLAARSVIPRLWRSVNPPTLSSWLQEVAHLHRMEELLADSRRRVERHVVIWTPWLDLLSSPDFSIPHSPTSLVVAPLVTPQ